MATKSFLDIDALRLAESAVKSASLEKSAFVPAGDPAMMDPAMMGQAGAGMDPAAMGGMDPSMMGQGAPPGMGMPPSMPGGAMTAMQPMMQQIGQSMAANKPKIDQNVVMMQILNLLARVVDHLGIPVPAQAMVATPQAMDAMAMQTQSAQPQQAPPFPPIQPIGGGTKQGSEQTNNGTEHLISEGTSFDYLAKHADLTSSTLGWFRRNHPSHAV